MVHDFKNFPELTNAQMQLYYFESPHKQITEDFKAEVVKVTDGDTIRILWDERTFNFPVRFLDIAAPENKESGGPESRNWLEGKILGETVEIQVNPSNRVDKWGRLLGKITFKGLDIGDESILTGHSVSWDEKKGWSTTKHR